MKIKVKDTSRKAKVIVRRVGVLQGVAESFIQGQRVANQINRVALRGHRIFRLGSSDEFESPEDNCDCDAYQHGGKYHSMGCNLGGVAV